MNRGLSNSDIRLDLFELDLAGYPGQWIFAYQRTLFAFGSNQKSSANIQNTLIQRFCTVEHQTDHWTEWTNWLLGE